MVVGRTRFLRSVPLAALLAASAAGASSLEEDLERVDRQEEVLLELGTPLLALSRSMENLVLPDPETRDVFAETVDVVDVADAQAVSKGSVGGHVRLWEGSLSAKRSWSRGELDLWRSLLERVSYFEHAKVYVRDGRFLEAGDQAQRVFETAAGFTGLARRTDGEQMSVAADLRLRWHRGEDGSWRVAAWQTESLRLQQVRELLFEDVLGRALPDPGTRRRAIRSIAEENNLQFLSSEEPRPPHPYFDLTSTDRHPGLAVVDVDRDGWDDLYVMARWGRNLLLHNQGDGTFHDVAPRWGLDLDGHTSSAVFADFDNDGDADVIVGRTLVPSRYFVNEGDRFVDRTDAWIEGALPSLVSSVSVADWNGDGLLDVYFSTYGGVALLQEMFFNPGMREQALQQKRLLAGFVSDEDARHLFETFPKKFNPRLAYDRPGPRNLLLENRGGGRFAPVDAGDVWRNTFQASWSDYDDDGDADLYLANDFAPNNLLRNDGGSFTDVTAETRSADLGFGMGASWGDYDNDGRMDLYVSNMFTKAGRRITRELGEVGASFAPMARGNTLLAGRTDGFEHVSGLSAPRMQVEKAGWSWGSQLLDYDNDGFLDVYALSGFYTAPPEVASQVDT